MAAATHATLTMEMDFESINQVELVNQLKRQFLKLNFVTPIHIFRVHTPMKNLLNMQRSTKIYTANTNMEWT